MIARISMAAEGHFFTDEINRLNGLLMEVETMEERTMEEKEKTPKAEPLASGWGYFLLNKQG